MRSPSGIVTRTVGTLSGGVVICATISSSVAPLGIAYVPAKIALARPVERSNTLPSVPPHLIRPRSASCWTTSSPVAPSSTTMSTVVPSAAGGSLHPRYSLASAAIARMTTMNATNRATSAIRRRWRSVSGS
jgi:hypothetical protein